MIQIRVRQGSCQKKINTIKEIRYLTGFSLVEAKSHADEIFDGGHMDLTIRSGRDMEGLYGLGLDIERLSKRRFVFQADKRNFYVRLERPDSSPWLHIEMAKFVWLVFAAFVLGMVSQLFF